ncbi:hypothetical protein ACIQNU_11405 [Streptomyces sp. NPDC091292]|uniref:hypothetical protein n=1 Tax=Streptomyces sp. NPDC091292 TaxID=3365991 RepID=UPI0038053B26
MSDTSDVDGGEDELASARIAALLTGALRPDTVDPAAEARAVAAFTAARGTHPARTRRRDDWRPHRPRRPARRSVRVGVGALLAGVALGGVAVASIGGGGTGGGGGTSQDERHLPDQRPAHSAPEQLVPEQPPPPSTAPPTPESPTTGDTHGPAGRPDTAKSTEAHCRSYLKHLAKGKDKGPALQSTAWQRLIRAAGGEDHLTAYCEEILAETPPPPKPTEDTPPTETPSKGEGEANGQGNGKSNGKGKGMGKGMGKGPKKDG